MAYLQPQNGTAVKTGAMLVDNLHAQYRTMADRDDQVFFRAMGQRIAALRKEQHLTQTQLAEILGISQQLVASYEVGRRKVPASMLPVLAQTFAVPAEQLLGMHNQAAKRGPAPKLVRQIEQIQKLPRTKQRFVIEMLDTVLRQTG